jgi:hypothetical protein
MVRESQEWMLSIGTPALPVSKPDQGSHLEHPNYRTALSGGGPNSCWWRFMYMDRASNADIYKTTIAAVEEAALVIVAPQEEVMNDQVPKYVTQARASFLLGMPEAELSRISKESGLGHVERAGNEKETYFTYEELYRICLLSARQMEAVH